MFSQLKNLIKDVPGAQTILDQIETEFNLNTVKLNESISSRDKTKSVLNLVKSKLEITDDTLTDENLTSKLKSIKDFGETEYTKKVKVLSDKLLEEQQKAETVLITLNKDKIDLTVKNALSNFNIVTKGAENLVETKLRDGLSVKDGKVVYEDDSSVEDKLKVMKEDESFSFIFSNETLSGSGLKTGSGSNNNNGASDFEKRNGDKLRKLGLK